jgi:hypothetical protein
MFPEMFAAYQDDLNGTYPTLPEDVRYHLSQVDGIGQVHGNTCRKGAMWVISNGNHIVKAYFDALLAFQDYRTAYPYRDTRKDPELDNLMKAIAIADKNVDDLMANSW